MKLGLTHVDANRSLMALQEKGSKDVVADHGRGAVDADAAAGRQPRAPPNPGSVKINVQGAFIVDDDTAIKNGNGGDGIHYEHKDIRLPHHTAVVSHVAVDVILSENVEAQQAC